MKKKAQIKFGETIGVIFIVYIIILAGFIWYNDITQDNLREIYEEDQLSRAFEKYYFIVNFDLIHVGQFGIMDEEFDINSLRVMKNFSKTSSGKAYLDKRLDESTAIVRVYDKDFISIENITLYNKTPGNNIDYDTQIFRSMIPIIDEINKSTYMGILEIYTYSYNR